MFRMLVLIIVAGLAGYGIHAFAQNRIDVEPAVTAVGTSSSNGVSFAWFYESADRKVYVCRTGPKRGDLVHCSGQVTLP